MFRCFSPTYLGSYAIGPAQREGSRLTEFANRKDRDYDENAMCMKSKRRRTYAAVRGRSTFPSDSGPIGTLCGTSRRRSGLAR